MGDEPPKAPDRPTVQLDPRELMVDDSQKWTLVSAALERAAPWGLLAFRCGVLAMLVECANAMAMPNAPKDLVARARELVDVLNKISWER